MGVPELAPGWVLRFATGAGKSGRVKRVEKGYEGGSVDVRGEIICEMLG